MDNIYPELFSPGDAAAKNEDLHKAVGLWPCHNQGGNQYWMLNKTGEIRLVFVWLKKYFSCPTENICS